MSKAKKKAGKPKISSVSLSCFSQTSFTVTVNLGAGNFDYIWIHVYQNGTQANLPAAGATRTPYETEPGSNKWEESKPSGTLQRMGFFNTVRFAQAHIWVVNRGDGTIEHQMSNVLDRNSCPP